MSKIWITTDTHFGHANMVAYCGRPVDFSERILANLHFLQPEDTLIHLGDICIGGDAYWHEKLSGIHCRKILVKGNHDNKSNSWYLSHGWDFVCNSFTLTISGKKVVFSHQPQCLADNDFNIHGHFHNQLNRLKRREWVVADEEKRNHYNLKTLTINHINISLEGTKYQPVLLTNKLLEETSNE